MYRVIIDTLTETNKFLCSYDTRQEAIAAGLTAKKAGAKFVTIHGPLGKVPLDAYLR